MNRKIRKPEINKKMKHGAIMFWKIKPSIIKRKDTYCYRIDVTFADGETTVIQRGGFRTRHDAEISKQQATIDLGNHCFVPYDFTVREFYDWWLYYHMLDDKKIAYDTYMSYRNCIYNYLLKYWDETTRMSQLDSSYVSDFLNSMSSSSLFRTCSGIMSSSMRDAKNFNFIGINPSATSVGIAVRKRTKQLKEAVDSSEADFQKEKFRTYNCNQAAYFLYTCKANEPEIYLPVLFSLTMGMRISEAFAVRFSDVDFGKRQIHISVQLGRRTDGKSINGGPVTAQEIPPKSDNGQRIIPAPDFVIDEIISARTRYIEKQKNCSDFRNNDYITCQYNGNAIPVASVYPKYQRIINLCHLPYIKWHELRHTYATLLAAYGISMKAISVCMGHYAEGFTDEVYVSHQDTVYDAVAEICDFAKNILPEKSDSNDMTINEKYLLDVVPCSTYNKKR